jgi:hypothetical protein
LVRSGALPRAGWASAPGPSHDVSPMCRRRSDPWGGTLRGHGAPPRPPTQTATPRTTPRHLTSTTSRPLDTCMRTYIHTCHTHTYMHTHTHTWHTHIHGIHTHTWHTWLGTHTDTYIHTWHSYTHIHCTHTYMAYTHMRTYIHTYAYIHTYIWGEIQLEI